MPSSSLNAPHFQQELDSSCVAACVRMVLAYYGDVRSEADLRTLLDTQPTGTRAGNIVRMSGPAFEVYLRPSNLAELQAVLADNQPAIVFLQTGALEYWDMDIFHTAVLVGLDAVTVALNDPYLAAAPQMASLQSFEKEWQQPVNLLRSSDRAESRKPRRFRAFSTAACNIERKNGDIQDSRRQS